MRTRLEGIARAADADFETRRHSTGGIRAAVGFGADGRSEQVRRRYAQVPAVANAHMPPEVAPIETWVLAERRKPARIG